MQLMKLKEIDCCDTLYKFSLGSFRHTSIAVRIDSGNRHTVTNICYNYLVLVNFPINMHGKEKEFQRVIDNSHFF